MEGAVISHSRKRTKPMSSWSKALLVSASIFVASGCSGGAGPPEREVGGLTAITYNYSEDHLTFVRVDGGLVGSGLKAVEPGGVSGGGRTCCVELNAYAEILPVEITPPEGDAYMLKASVEQPWPKGASTVIVHVLPGRKVVIETTLGAENAPRKDLMDARLAELGIEKEVETPD